jgi:hypothetical protein
MIDAAPLREARSQITHAHRKHFDSLIVSKKLSNMRMGQNIMLQHQSTRRTRDWLYYKLYALIIYFKYIVEF